MFRIAIVFAVLALHMAIPAFAGEKEQAKLEPLVPNAIKNDEVELRQQAATAKPVDLDNGAILQYDLVAARVATHHGERDLQVRLWIPASRAITPTPVLVYVHGGGFIGGSWKTNLADKKASFVPAFRELLKRGYIVASADYRLAREAGWPAPVRDVRCILRFLRKNADLWGLDMERLGICGHSAGARLTGMIAIVADDDFHRGSLPWEGSTPIPRAIQLWAGSIYNPQSTESWIHFSKPRNFSVERLLFGEHPAWSIPSRIRTRIRTQPPHYAGIVPALRLVRGKSDYGGNHKDAQAAVEIWTAFGAEAKLNVYPGGHNTAGPAEDTADYFVTTLTNEDEKVTVSAESVAKVMLERGDAPSAIDVLAQGGGGVTLPGTWYILNDDVNRVVYLPVIESLPASSRSLATKAVAQITAAELAQMEAGMNARNWQKAASAARNVSALKGEESIEAHVQDILGAAAREENVFLTLAEANTALHAGKRDEALDLLAGEDSRLMDARKRIERPLAFKVPPWAETGGIDVYGAWADLRLSASVKIRMRYIEKGSWTLPEQWAYRNTLRDPLVKKIEITKSFWIAETETTQESWVAVLTGKAKTPRMPKNRIEYIQILDWLNSLSEKYPSTVFRLPTEAEWLHALTCGGRTDTMAATDLHAVTVASVDTKNPGPKDVASRLPQLGGLYDMLGNVMEWTCSPGSNEARFTDKKGAFQVWAYPIARGGGWGCMPEGLNPSWRMQQRHTNRQEDLGFRLVISGNPDESGWLKNIKRK